MSTIKQLIVNTIIEISKEYPATDVEGETSADEIRNEFIKVLLAKLFPDDDPVVLPVPVVRSQSINVPVDVPEAVPESPTKQRKRRAPMSDEAKADMKAKRQATMAAKKAVETNSPVQNDSVMDTSPVDKEIESLTEKMETLKVKKEKKPKAEKPKPDANLPKIDPTWRKHLKKADKDHAKELEPELLAYLNAKTKEEFNGKSAEEHIAEFIASRAKPSDDGKVETDLEIVEFEGKEYYVNPETKRVYEGEGVYDEEVGWTNYKAVGYVGMAAFAEMTLDD